MKSVLTFFLLLSPVLANAEIQREINGVNYYLFNDFDSGDGECTLRGAHYASSFYSMSTQSTNVIKLNSNGTVKEILPNGTAYDVIADIQCE